MAWQPDYVDLEVMRDYLRITEETDTADDDVIEVAITSASRAIDRTCNRQFGNGGDSPVTRRYTAEWSAERRKYIVDVDDLYDEAELTIESAGTAITDYTLLPLNAEADGRPYTRVVFDGSVSCIEGDISVTSESFGWAEIPATIVQATQLQASRLVKRRDAPFGVAGSPDMGNELRLLAKLDPDVAVMVRSYRRWWGAA